MLNDADQARAQHIVDAARQDIAYCKDTTAAELANDSAGQALLIRSLEIIGEAASQIPLETREQFRGVPWKQMIATRNRLIHGYFDVDLDIVWRTVKDRLPDLVSQLETILSEG
jgi:uncharacterized protein with HEPN domain